MNRQDGSGGKMGGEARQVEKTGSVETVLSCGEDQAQRIRDIFIRQQVVPGPGDSSSVRVKRDPAYGSMRGFCVLFKGNVC